MTDFFLSILLIFAGGIFPLIFRRQFALMKTGAIILISAGCAIGLISALLVLLDAPQAPAAAGGIDLGSFSLAFQIDGLAAFFLMVIFLICLLAAIYSFHYLDQPQKSLAYAVQYLFFSLLIGSMALVVTAADMLAFMLAWELMSLSSFFLVISDYQSRQNRRAGYLYFVFSHVGAMFILAAFGLIYGMGGSLGFNAAAGLPADVKLIVFVLALIGFGSKAGVFPVHVWLPHAHPAAPSHISAVMSGVMIKTGIYGIVRLYLMLDMQTAAPGQLVLAAGMVSGILGVVYALGQNDIKRLLAYSSVENVGIILIGTGIGMIGMATGRPAMAVLGFGGGLLHVLNHGIFKSLLFMGAGMVLQKTGSRTIDALGGLIKQMKITGATFLIGSLAISGLPPFNGFVSELFIYIAGFNGAGLNQSGFVAGILAIISLAVIGGLALACFTRVVGVVFQGEPRSPMAQDAQESGAGMLTPMVILASLCALIGVFPGVFMRLVLKAVASLGLDAPVALTQSVLQLTGYITLAILIFCMLTLLVWGLRTWAYRGKTVGRGGTWGCGFTQPTPRMQYTGSSYAASILEFFRPVAPLAERHQAIRGRFPAPTAYQSHVDDIAEKHMDRGVVQPVLFLFDKLRWMQHGDIHLYIGYILLAIVVLLFFV